jgi:predicted XRE-type DNA-binding protein
LNLSRFLADIVGFSTLALLCGLCFTIFPGLEEIRQHPSFYVGAYIVLSTTAWWVFWRKDLDGSKEQWPSLVLASILGGLAFFACDIVIGRVTHSDLSLLNSAFHVGGLAGFGVTLMVCPGITFVALAGWCRSTLLRRLIPTAPENLTSQPNVRKTSRDRFAGINEMSRNPFLDLGFSHEEAAALHIRSQLVAALEYHIDQKGWGQTKAAKALRVPQPTVCKIVNGNIEKLSIEFLIKLMVRADLPVRVSGGRPASPRRRAHPTAATA